MRSRLPGSKQAGSPPGVLGGVFRRQRRRTALAALCWASHQVCEALVPVAFGLVIDRAVRTGDGSAMVWSVLAILGLFLVLTLSWRTGSGSPRFSTRFGLVALNGGGNCCSGQTGVRPSTL